MVAINQQRLFLIGAAGTGKTVIGRGLARLLNFRFHDIDSMVEQRSGVDIPWIIEVEGVQGVSQREHKLLTELTHQHSIVVSTGSDIVLDANNRRLLSKVGVLIHLRACCEQRCQRLYKRYGVDPNDPQLQYNLLADEKRLLPYYTKLADITIDTDNLTHQAIVSRLAKRLTSYLAA